MLSLQHTTRSKTLSSVDNDVLALTTSWEAGAVPVIDFETRGDLLAAPRGVRDSPRLALAALTAIV